MTFVRLIGWALFAGYLVFVLRFERWKRRNELPPDHNERLFVLELSTQLGVGVVATATGDGVVSAIFLGLTIGPYLLLSGDLRPCSAQEAQAELHSWIRLSVRSGNSQRLAPALVETLDPKRCCLIRYRRRMIVS